MHGMSPIITSMVLKYLGHFPGMYPWDSSTLESVALEDSEVSLYNYGT